MSTMPGRVAKTASFESLDDSLSADPRDYMNKYDDQAISFSDLLKEALSSGVITAHTRDHVDGDWIGGDFWPKKGVAEVLRLGLYWATRLAFYEDGDIRTPRHEKLRVVSCWICSGGPFEVVNLVSDRQITMLLMTEAPPPDELEAPSGHGHQPIWTTRHVDEGKDKNESEIESAGDTMTVRPQL